MVRSVFLAVFALALIAAGSASANCEPGEIVIKFSHVTATTGHPKGEAAEVLADRVNRELQGRACMEVYPNSQLFSDNDVLDALLSGEAHLAAPSLSKFERYTKKFRVFDLPFLFQDIDAVDTFQGSEIGQTLLTAMEPDGLRGLAFWRNGMKQLSASRPLLAPEDAAGLTFRIQPSDVLQAQFEELGAGTKKMAFKDVFGALQSGEVQGQENTWSNIYTKEFYRVQDGITESNHGLIDYLVVTSSAFWDGLPDDVRAQLNVILTQVTLERNHRAFELAEANKAKVIEAGAKVRVLSPEARAVWVRALKPVWAKFEAEIGAEVIAAAEASNATLDERVVAFERRLIEEALREHGGRLMLAAAALGVSRGSLKARLRQHGLNLSEFR